MCRKWVWLGLLVLFLLWFSEPAIAAFPPGRVVVLGTEFYWLDTSDPNNPELSPLRFTGYSDYDLLTAVPTNRVQLENTCTEENTCSITGGSCNEQKPCPDVCRVDIKTDANPYVVDESLFGAVLDRLFATATPPPPNPPQQKANLLRVWVSGKHNARDWYRPPNRVPADVVNEHDLPAYARDPISGGYRVFAPFDADDYLPRLTALVDAAFERNIVVMLTIFDNITLRSNGRVGYNWGTSPWFWRNQASPTLADSLPEDGKFHDQDAYPNWYFVDPVTGATNPFGSLVGAQVNYISEVLKAVQGKGNVILEIMNEPAPEDHNSQGQIAVWHELMGLVIHAIDPTRITVTNLTLHPDEQGIFRGTTLGCTDMSDPSCQPRGVGSDASNFFDLPDLDAISLHFSQWGENSDDNDETLDKLEVVLSRTSPNHLLTSNIKPVIIDTDAAQRIDNSLCNPPGAAG